MRLLRIVSLSALAAAAAGCGGLLGGGKPPATLQTLTALAADPGPVSRMSAAGKAVTIMIPVVPKELKTVRVPVQVTATDLQYVTGLQWVDTPDRLFQNLLSETVHRTTGRVVLDANQTGLDPGLVLSGQLQRFGYDAYKHQVVVTFDGSLAAVGGAQVETRRFIATAPSDGTGASVGPALNTAANQVAVQVAQWIGG
jgi:cholesterol transport system auxiliary component